MTTSFNAEQRTFLIEEPRTAHIGTVRKDGRPHVVPVWFDLDGDTVVFSMADSSVKAENMRRDPRVTVTVDDEQPPFAYIMIEGTATLSSPTDGDLEYWSGRLAGRYVGHEEAANYGKRNSEPGMLIVRVTPTKVTYEGNIMG